MEAMLLAISDSGKRRDGMNVIRGDMKRAHSKWRWGFASKKIIEGKLMPSPRSGGSDFSPAF